MPFERLQIVKKTLLNLKEILEQKVEIEKGFARVSDTFEILIYSSLIYANF